MVPLRDGEGWSEWRVGDLGVWEIRRGGSLDPGPASPPVLETSRFSTGTAWQARTLDLQATPVSSVRPAVGGHSLGVPPSCSDVDSSLPPAANLLPRSAVLRIPLESLWHRYLHGFGVAFALSTVPNVPIRSIRLIPRLLTLQLSDLHRPTHACREPPAPRLRVNCAT